MATTYSIAIYSPSGEFMNRETGFRTIASAKARANHATSLYCVYVVHDQDFFAKASSPSLPDMVRDIYKF